MAEPVAPPPRTQTMYGPDGSPVEVPLADVPSAARSGRLGFAAGQTVHVVDPSTGAIVPVSGDAAAKTFGSIEGATATAAHAGDFQLQERRKQLETVGNQAAAAGIGLARGATAGFLDPLAAEVGGEKVRKYLADQQKINPGLSAVGEIAGMIAPALLTGGASAEAGLVARTGRAATVIPRGITAAGEVGGKLAERGLVSLGAESGGRAAGAARVLAQNAVEGAAQGVGLAVSEASLKDEPITVEKLLAAAGHGSLAGAGLGGALHGSLALGKMGAAKAGGAIKQGASDIATATREKLVSKIVGTLDDDAAKVAARELEGAPRLPGFDAGVEAESRGFAQQGGASRGGSRKAPGVGDGMPDVEAAKDKVREFLKAASAGDIAAMEKQGNDFITRRAAEQMGIATEGKGAALLREEIANNRSIASLTTTSAKAQKNLDKLTKDARSLLPGMIEEDLRAVAGLEKHALMSRAEMQAAAPLLKKEAGNEMESLLIGFDKAAAGDASKLPSLTKSSERIEREVIEPMLAEVRVTMPDGSVKWRDGGTRAKIAQDVRDQIETHVGSTSFKDMHSARKYFDEGVNFSATSKADVMKSKAMRAARDLMDDELTLAGDRAVASASGESALKWKAAKNRWAAANTIEENAKIGAGLDAKNRVLGLSEQLGSAKYSAIGTAVGGTLGSVVPVFGTAIGSALGGVAGSLVGTHAAAYSRRYGDQIVAKIAREAGTDGVLRGVMGQVDGALDSKLGTYLGEKGIQAAAAAKKKGAGLLDELGIERGVAATEQAAEKAGKPGKYASAAAREEAKTAAEVERLQAKADASPGFARRAIVDKIAAIKDAGQAKIAALKAKAEAAGETIGRVYKALPSAPAVATEAERIGNRAADSRDDEYKAKRQQYADLAASPRAREEATAAIRQTHPELAKSLDRKLAEIAAYVDKRAPLSTRALATLTPNAVKDTVSPGQRAQFLELTKVAEDPLSVLDDLQTGRVTASQMRAVRDLYPALHAEIAAKVIDKLADRTEPLPYKKRLEIGLLIGAPTDASLEPAMIAAAQSTFAPPPNAAPPPRASTSAATPTRQLAATTKMAGLEAGAE